MKDEKEKIEELNNDEGKIEELKNDEGIDKDKQDRRQFLLRHW